MNNEDIKHLDLLSIFHYVVGGITALFACMPLMHVFMGIAIILGAFDKEGGSSNGPPPVAIGWMFALMGATFVLIGWCMAILIIIAGRKLKQRKSRMFCMVVAGVECMFMPFGTVLGIFTIIILNKDSVKEIFAKLEDE